MAHGPRIPIGQQLAELRRLGVRTRPSVGPAEIQEAAGVPLEGLPRVGVLMALAAEMSLDGSPQGGLADHVGKFDIECVEDGATYDRLIRFITGIAGIAGIADAQARLTAIAASVDLDEEFGQISYRIDGVERSWDVEVQGDWADTLALSYVMDDVAPPGNRYVQFWDEQTMGFAFVPAAAADELQRLLDTPGTR